MLRPKKKYYPQMLQHKGCNFVCGGNENKNPVCSNKKKDLFSKH